MAPRAYWKGFVKLSLVSFPVRLYAATSSASKIAFNQVHKDTKQRIKMVPHEPDLGPVSRDDLVKGYEFEKGKFVIIEPQELDKIKIESDKTIQIEKFVKADEIDELFLDSPYYMAPDGPAADDSFRVLMTAMERKNVVAIARVVMAGRERLVCIGPRGNGALLRTLRYANEIRGEFEYFEDINGGGAEKELLKLGEALVDQHLGAFDPEEFTDRYAEAVLDLVKAKVAGKSFEVIEDRAPKGDVVSLMDALRQSVESAEKKPPAKNAARAKTKKAG